jgi:hypothetical protein
VICDPSIPNINCLQFDNDGDVRRCHVLCNPQASGQCSHKAGLTCLAFQTGGTEGVCLDLTCTQDSDCLYTDYTCVASSAGGNICYPPTPTGPNTFGTLCDTPARTKGCTTGTFCLREQNKSAGFCSVDCSQSGVTCPKLGTLTSTCESLGTNFSACVFKCTTNADCPTGLSCNTSFGLCLAP